MIEVQEEKGWRDDMSGESQDGVLRVRWFDGVDEDLHDGWSHME